MINPPVEIRHAQSDETIHCAYSCYSIAGLHSVAGNSHSVTHSPFRGCRGWREWVWIISVLISTIFVRDRWPLCRSTANLVCLPFHIVASQPDTIRPGHPRPIVELLGVARVHHLAAYCAKCMQGLPPIAQPSVYVLTFMDISGSL
jgi:hypothetical protein